MLNLQTPVLVRTPDGVKAGAVVARTYEESPKYDVRLEDGATLVNVATELVTAEERIAA